MNGRTKKIVMIGVMGLSITLLSLGFIIGFVDEEKKKKATDHSIGKSNDNENKDIWQYTPKDEAEKEGSVTKDKTDLEDEVREGKVENESPENSYLKVPDEVSKNPTQSDMFPEKDLEETKAIANEFVLKYHAFDKGNPTRHLDSVEGLLEQGHINFLKDSKEGKIEGLKDVKGIASRKVLSVEINEPVAPTLIAISWDAVVISEVVDNKGEIRKVSDNYSMMFEKEGRGDYQITNYYLNYDQKR